MNETIPAGGCDLCGASGELTNYKITPAGYAANEIKICVACLAELAKQGKPDKQYWRFLAEAMWSDIPAVQVLAWRLLTQLSGEGWAADCLDLLYLDDDILAWAKAGSDQEEAADADLHRDSLGQELQAGDTVVLIRTLDVKGSSLSVKMGTVVKNIRLVLDNTDQIEGKIDGQTIVILTKYLRKQKN